MTAIVNINGREVETAEDDSNVARIMMLATRLHRIYNVDELNKSGVAAEVFVEGVQSKMNAHDFVTED